MYLSLQIVNPLLHENKMVLSIINNQVHPIRNASKSRQIAPSMWVSRAVKWFDALVTRTPCIVKCPWVSVLRYSIWGLYTYLLLQMTHILDVLRIYLIIPRKRVLHFHNSYFNCWKLVVFEINDYMKLYCISRYKNQFYLDYLCFVAHDLCFHDTSVGI